ncbi:hypothetical protein [Thiocapsa rosea]|uniref:Uncharacterized protein n=1 Tax=Thiocapsa rosea TaxID=69360 RepID=A0A495VGN1_9GAMM|nr:hypothetical protein [Thiocapsa rosea]RKT47617.1 hypothetical protein BDD21_5218 [Thiocapsa rosea]
MNQQILTAVLLAGAAPAALGYDYQASTGALSYSFFNLGPNTYTLTPYTNNPNPSAPNGSNAQAQGWNNHQVCTLQLFGSWDWVYATGTKNPCHSKGQDPGVPFLDEIVFYWDYDDPAPAPAAAINLPIGTSSNQSQYSVATSPLLNPPAYGDSWTLVNPTTNNTMVMASFASAGNILISGFEAGGNQPYASAADGYYYNSGINPPGPPDASDGALATPAGTVNQPVNPFGANFTNAVMNLNVSSSDPGYLPTGGLWLGVNNPNSSKLATDSLNLAMYPVNLAAYVKSNEVNTGIDQWATPIYGGHFTLAIGDPFLISSYAAKILWFIATNTGYAFSSASLSESDLQTLMNKVALPGNNGVFKSDANSAAYANWLLASPGVAESVIGTMNTAASKPITHESIWGKIFSGLVTTATDVAVASIGLLAGPEASIGVEAGVKAAEGVGEAADGAVTHYSSSAISADFTTTESMPAPVAQDAPAVINDTYSSSNLLGMLLTNSFVQAEINNALGLGNTSGEALWTNYSIAIPPQPQSQRLAPGSAP